MGSSRLRAREGDRTCLEVAYTAPLAGIPLWKTCTSRGEEEDTPCLEVTCIHSFHGALVDYSCLTFGVGDSF